jgi:hypothetical protein
MTTTNDRGYGNAHQKLRKVWEKRIEAADYATGYVACARCLKPILPGMKWDLGHDDHDRSKYTGPEHRRCNRATSKPKLFSRIW